MSDAAISPTLLRGHKYVGTGVVVVVEVVVVLGVEVVVVVVGPGRLQVAMVDTSASDRQRVHVALFNIGAPQTPPHDGITFTKK